MPMSLIASWRRLLSPADLPKDREVVIVWNEKHNIPVVVQFVGDQFFSPWGDVYSAQVHFWMRAPESPYDDQ